jgi:hypothetical protein
MRGKEKSYFFWLLVYGPNFGPCNRVREGRNEEAFIVWGLAQSILLGISRCIQEWFYSHHRRTYRRLPSLSPTGVVQKPPHMTVRPMVSQMEERE